MGPKDSQYFSKCLACPKSSTTKTPKTWGTTGQSHHQISTSQVQLQSIPASACRQPAENRFCLTWVVKNTYALNHSMVCFMTKKICDSDHTSRAPAPLGTPHGGAAACFAIYLAFWSPDGVQNSRRRQLTCGKSVLPDLGGQKHLRTKP